ncbi:protein LAZY 1-like [Curcuma longa]|uniref:protein LAZY 1-like n=1 Tax=Curcuma longa TaxID=136217 RepID=UPI003D9DE051
MHRKFRQNGGEELKDLGGAAGGTCNCLAGRPSLDLDLNRRRYHYDPLKARSLRLHVEALNDGGGGEEDPIVEELFEGLLTIGTLGVGTGPIEERTEEEEMKELAVIEEVEGKPLLATSEEVAVVAIPAALEAIAEKEAEATTETDLIMVSAELEKVLTAEEEKGGGRMSSARSSHSGAAACPLQGFLFGLPVEAAETVLMEAEAAGGSRRERRASLGELFMMSRIAEEGEAKFAGGDGEGKLTAEMYLTKKKPTKHRGRKGSSDGVNASTMEKKFQKILQLFHKKVHPESTIMSKKPLKTGKTEKENSSASKVATSKATSRKENSSISNFSNVPSSVNRGHWIKTDAECKYIDKSMLVFP